MWWNAALDQRETDISATDDRRGSSNSYLGCVSEVIVRRVTDQDDVRSFEILVPARREWASRQEGIDQYPMLG
jgi:hypothetical protein